MNRISQRYNAKARSSTAGGFSHKKRKRAAPTSVEHPHASPAHTDSNAEIIVPKSEEAKEQDRKERLRQELLAQSNSKVNAKKKKRLEKYIEKKLKQEDRVTLFEKLSKSQAEINALDLHSSSTLGTGTTKTHHELQERGEDKEVSRVFDGPPQKKGKKPRNRQVRHSAPSGLSDESDDSSGGSDVDMGFADEEGKSRSNPVVIVDSGFSTAAAELAPSVTHITSEVGSALKRKADGSVIAPKVFERKPKGKTAFASWNRGKSKQQVQAESDTSFDSSDSTHDSDSDQEKDDEDEEAEPWNGFGAGAEEDDTSDSDTDEDEASEESEEDSEAPPIPTQPKRLGFKQWAMQQLSAAKGYVAPVSAETEEDPPQEPEPAPPSKKRKVDSQGPPGEMRGPLGRDLVLPNTSFAQKLQESARQGEGKVSSKKAVLVNRPPDVEEARLLLPIVAEEQSIMEAILLNSVVIICGETGSGKTTQVPQFLYEAGFGVLGSVENPGMIGITQPRRVAAMSMASRVAYELSLTSSKVSYQIRYDATVSPETSLKFMTDGVLLRELATDFLLTKYSVVIIDEAHERSMNTDILIGVLSRVIKLREQMWLEKKDDIKPLRLIIMSATLRVSDFAENKTLFSSPPPIIQVPARQHPVTIHFSRRTQPDYVSEAVRKASKIHSRLPPGGILIFLTGQNEITGVCRKLEARYGAKALQEKRNRRIQRDTVPETPEVLAGLAVMPKNADLEPEDIDLGTAETEDVAVDVDGDPNDVDDDDDDDALDSEDDDNEAWGIDTEESDVPMHIVPLYALLPSEKQMRVFQPPPAGHRQVVVATNVAETSLTIPDIRYVVDCGRAKERRYNITNGIQSFQVGWISKASAAQRAGRAGRTGPGHCYRLYSSALFENYFEQFSQPEIVRMPIEGVVLQMKSMHVDSVLNFPFPTPPDRSNLRKAETILTNLGALSAPAKGLIGNGEITEVGEAMSLFPLSPRYSRMLVSGRQHGCIPYLVITVAALSVGDPFLREEAIDNDDSDDGADLADGILHIKSDALKAKELRRIQRKAFFQNQQLHASLGNSSSDVFRILSVVGAYEFAGGSHQFCDEHFVRPKAMEEIHKLRAQINNIVHSNFPDINIGFTSNLKPPSTLQLKVLRQLLTAGFIDQVAVRKDRVEKASSSGQQFTTSRGVAYQAMGVAEDVFIHPSSVLFGISPPEFVVFTEIVRTSKAWMKGLTVINPAWLSSLGKPLCTFSKPVKNKDGESMVIPRYGPSGWELPAIKQPVS